ncbi:hypothetical protein RYZ26_12855 [Terasakiella sp. A23]|nr:hypothetical protein [Terasakiella sp. A23]MDV7340488.1 hypothetical protein [Terasakiella sp. A23]
MRHVIGHEGKPDQMNYRDEETNPDLHENPKHDDMRQTFMDWMKASFN